MQVPSHQRGRNKNDVDILILKHIVDSETSVKVTLCLNEFACKMHILCHPWYILIFSYYAIKSLLFLETTDVPNLKFKRKVYLF